MKTIQDFLNRLASGRSFVVLGVLAVALVLTVNFADLPWTLPGFQRLTQGAGIPDMQRHYDADGAYRILAAQGETGRAYYLRSLWTLDVALPVLAALWLAIAIVLALRHASTGWRGLAFLELLPLAAGISDLLENSAISVLLVNYPERFDAVANAAGYVTSLKHGLYTLSLITALVIWAMVLIKKATDN